MAAVALRFTEGGCVTGALGMLCPSVAGATRSASTSTVFEPLRLWSPFDGVFLLPLLVRKDRGMRAEEVVRVLVST